MTTLAAPPTPGSPPPGPTPTALAAVRRGAPDAVRTLYALLASALGTLPLKALFTDSAWLWDVWLAMAVVIAPAAIMRIWRRASALQTWAGVLLLVPYLTLRFVHQHAIAAVIPGPGTWHDVHLLLIGLHNTTAHGIAPVHSTNAIRLVLCTVLPLIAALIDMLAVAGRHGALAGVPLLVIYTISGAVPRHPVSWPLFVFGAAAFLVLISLDSRDDLQRWGHYVPRTGQATRRAAGAISAQRIAAVAVVLAVVIPAFVQSNTHNLLANVFHNDKQAGIGNGNGLGAGGTAGIDPFAKLRGELIRNSPVDLLTVHVQRLDSGPGTVQPFYARENVLANYNGQEWTSSGHGRLDPLESTSFESFPGTAAAPVSVTYRAEVTVDNLTSDPPVFVQPRLISDLTNDTAWSPQDQLLIGGSTRKNEEYQVNFQQPNPSQADLNAANGVDPDLAPWLALPTVATSVHQLVARLTAGASTQYEKARAIDTYFTNPANGFGYNLTVPPGKTGDPLVDFLTNKIGFCQQYAAAMGVMLRLAGVPSRVVLGYTHSAPNSNGYFTITTNDAHAWVEAYFDGIGWIPFDPTPLNGIADGTTNDLSWAPHATPSSATSSTSSGPINRASKPGNGLTQSRRPTAGTSSTTHTGVGVTLPIVGGVVVLVILGVAAPYLQRRQRRRSRLRAGRSGDADAVWAELTDTATDLGYTWSASRTPRQVTDWLAPAMGESRASLAALSAAVEQARYAPPGAVHVDGPALVREFAEVDGRLNASRERRVQLRARMLPASLGWTSGIPARVAGWLRVPPAWRNRRH